MRHINNIPLPENQHCHGKSAIQIVYEHQKLAIYTTSQSLSLQRGTQQKMVDLFHQIQEKCAICCRVAPSFLRVGHVELHGPGARNLKTTARFCALFGEKNLIEVVAKQISSNSWIYVYIYIYKYIYIYIYISICVCVCVGWCWLRQLDAIWEVSLVVFRANRVAKLERSWYVHDRTMEPKWIDRINRCKARAKNAVGPGPNQFNTGHNFDIPSPESCRLSN